MCHCDFCKKHTGSAFRRSAIFGEDQLLEIVGQLRIYNGLEIDGVGISGSTEDAASFYFCGTCGANVYFTFSRGPGFYGFGVGNFVDPGFPPPTVEFWTELRHGWLGPVPDAEAHPQFPQA